MKNCIFTLFAVLLSASLLRATPPPGTQADNNWIVSGDYDVSWYDGGASPEYVFTTPQQLAGLSYLINGNGNSGSSGTESPLRNKVFKLDADIDLSAHYWVPIGQGQNSFGGWFDGQGHTISGLYIDYSDESYAYTDPVTSTAANIYQGGPNANTGNMAALFGRTNNQSAGGYIKNIVFGTGQIKTHPSCFAAAALIAFRNSGAGLTVSNIINMGVEIIGGAQVGGIIGYSNGDAKYYNLANWAPVTVTYSNFIPNIMTSGGGIEGGAAATASNGTGSNPTGLYNSYNVGTVTVNSPADRLYIGNLIGVIGTSVANITKDPTPATGTSVLGSANYYLNNNNYHNDIGSESVDFFPGSQIATIEDMKTTGFLAALNEGNTGETWINKGGLPVFASTQMPTAIPEVKINPFVTYVENGVIVISGLQAGSPVKVYNLTGQIVWNGLAQQNLRITLSKGIYIIKTTEGQGKVIN